MNFTFTNPSRLFFDAENAVMPFGKYRGQKIKKIPYSYLLWLVENLKEDSEIKRKIQIFTNPVYRANRNKNIL